MKYPREIKSFAKRQRRLTQRQQSAIDYCWADKGIEPAQGVINLDQVFGRKADKVLEIGFGNGDSLWQMAQANADKDYVGVEVHEPGVASLFVHMLENHVENIRVIQADAVAVLSEHIADDTFSRVQIYFPDPWPKKRHHKRRIIQPEFLQLLRQKMRVGGVVHCATDWENYAMHMMEVLSNAPGFKNVAGEGVFSSNEDQQLRPNTKFERRGVGLGHGVWDLLFEKQSVG